MTPDDVPRSQSAGCRGGRGSRSDHRRRAPAPTLMRRPRGERRTAPRVRVLDERGERAMPGWRNRSAPRSVALLDDQFRDCQPESARRAGDPRCYFAVENADVFGASTPLVWCLRSIRDTRQSRRDGEGAGGSPLYLEHRRRVVPLALLDERVERDMAEGVGNRRVHLLPCRAHDLIGRGIVAARRRSAVSRSRRRSGHRARRRCPRC